MSYRLRTALFTLICFFSLTSMALAADVIKIGGVGPLSAPGSVEAGHAIKQGMQIAVDQVNAAGGLLGKQVELVYGDTAGTPEKGTSVMERLISKDGVVAVGGECHSSVTLAEMEVAHRYGIPLVVSEAWSDEITGKMYPEVFRVTVANSLIYTKAAEWMKEQNYAHVAVIAENSDWGLGVRDIFVKNLEKAGVKVTAMNAERTTTDFTPQLLQLKNATPPVDFIVDGFTGTGEFLMIKQAYELGIAPTNQCGILGAGTDMLYPAMWESLGEAGVYTLTNPAGLPGLPKTPVSESFNKIFKEKYDREADANAMEGYDSAMVILESIKAAGSTDSKAMIAAMEKISWEGTRGTITFTTESEPTWYYHQWQDVPVFIIQFTELNQEPSKSNIIWPDKYKTGDYVKPPNK